MAKGLYGMICLDYFDQDILENKLYNKLFDLYICMEDSLEDNKQAEL